MVPRINPWLAVLAFMTACSFSDVPPLDVDASIDAPVPDGPQQFTLTVDADGPGIVSSQPAGISCVADTCTMTYPAGAEVELTATPDSEASFVGFTGACNGTLSPCTVAMSADRTVGAAFRAFECEPDTTTCTQQTLVECDADGVADARICPLGCFPDGTRCYDLQPSNAGMVACLDDAALEADATIPDGATINTDNGAITLAGGGSVNVPSTPIAAPANGVAVRCFRTNNLMVGDVTVTGESALAIAANGTVTLTGSLSVSARAWDAPGPGHFSNVSCDGSDGTATGIIMIGGGGGGGFASTGGWGGPGGSGSANGGAGGVANGTPELIPLRGGCSGGASGAPGTPRLNAGGAVQIVSRVAIVAQATAGIAANGWGGGGTVLITTITRGGGSGGAILLEAPTVALPAQAFLVANGGGGGGKDPGMPGAISTSPALGGPAQPTGDTRYGAGGRGGAAMLPPSFGESSRDFGGGGGGSVGRIRVNAYNVFVPDAGSIVSPPPSLAMPGRR